MNKVDELIKRAHTKNDESDEYWLQLEKDITTFLRNCSKEDEDKIYHNARLDMIGMICDGIRNSE